MKAGRPKLDLNKDQIKQLAGIGCTMKEIAQIMNCSVDTLENNYSDAIIAGREIGKMSVRRMMWDHGKKGNTVALKYLVHNVLKERIEDPLQIKMLGETIATMPIEDIDEILKRHAEQKANAN